MLAFDSVVKVGHHAWRYAWSATTPPYRVYYEGELLETVTALNYTIEVWGATDEPPVIEVLDANETDPAENVAYPPRLLLQWRGVTAASFYEVRESVSGTWTTRRRVFETGAGYYQYTTRALTDVTTTNWRVVAIDSHSNESSPLAFDALIVRNPPEPSVSMAWNAGTGKLEVTSA